MKKLESSIPANNQKIIELYNKLAAGLLYPNPTYQRKLVWRKKHKWNFIDTILNNYPFPEIYLAQGEMNADTLSLTEQVVDGQQRLNTIKNYIEGKDVFSLKKIDVKKFSELKKEEKEAFLNYEVSVRYLKNATETQIKEIFQRINSTEYALNKTERLNAQWGDSEFICFAKQIIEVELDFDPDLINYEIKPSNRKVFLDFFRTKYSIFTENDINRMLALQYMMTLLATLIEGKYFRRNDNVQYYIENYYEEFKNAGQVEIGLKNTLAFIDSLGLDKKSYWFNKANIFTLIVECYKYDSREINKTTFKNRLLEMEEQNKLFSNFNKTKDIPEAHKKYFEFAKEAVNEKPTREYRGKIVAKHLVASLKK